MGSPGRLGFWVWPGGPWFIVGLQPPLSSFVFPPQRTLVLPLKGCAPLSFHSELSPPVSWNGSMFVFLVPLNRPKEERKHVSASRPPRTGPVQPERDSPMILPGGCWRRREIGPHRRVQSPTRVVSPSFQNAGCPRWRPCRASPGRAGGRGCGQHPSRANRSVAGPTGRPGEAALLELFFFSFNPAAWASRGSWPVARLLLREREEEKKL